MISIDEKEIMKGWLRQGEPVVSVKVTTYNHERYIEDALDSMLMQKTDFPFEIVVHEDASTDGTADIIRQYEEKYPNIVFPIYETENQYSKQDGSITRIMLSHMRGEYIAVCEGDDYWTDPLKLQKQYEALSAHPEVDICAHTVEIIQASNNEFIRFLKPESTDKIIPARNVILGGGDFVGTNSLFYRKNLDLYQPEFRKICRYDYALQVHGALRGGMLYLAECMSVYRYMTIGSWSSRIPFDEKKEAERNLLWDRTLSLLNKETDGKYAREIEQYTEECYMSFHYRFRHYDELKKYRNAYQRYKGKKRVKNYLLTHFPYLYIRLEDERKKRRKEKNTESKDNQTQGNDRP